MDTFPMTLLTLFDCLAKMSELSKIKDYETLVCL